MKSFHDKAQCEHRLLVTLGRDIYAHAIFKMRGLNWVFYVT